MATELDTLLAKINGMNDFVTGLIEVGQKPMKEEIDRMRTDLEKAVTLIHEAQRERIARMDQYGRPIVRTGRLAGYDLLSLRMLESVLRHRANLRGGFTSRGAAIMADITSARAAIQKSLVSEAVLGWQEFAYKRAREWYGQMLNDQALATYKDSLNPWTRQLVELATKALDSTTTSAGDELVPTFEAAELWMDVNLETRVLPLLRQVPMPTNPFDMPAQFGDTNWYPTSENIQGTTTSPTTAKATLTAYGLKTGVPFSDELEEDAIINLVAELRSNLVRNAAEVIDDVLLNGDTTVTNGINSDGATINTSSAGKAQWLLGFDGLIHEAIVDNSSNQSVNVNGALAHTSYNAVLRKLGRFAAPGRRGDVAFIVDVNTWIASLGLTQVLTLDVAGGRNTISTGELAAIYGSPIIVSEQMKLADTDGKVTDSGGNTVGRILGVNLTQWRVGFRRQITLEADREPGKSQTTLYVSFRIALTERTGTRSSATHTAIAYNITGVS